MIKIQSESFQQKFNKMLYKIELFYTELSKNGHHGHHIWFREGGTGESGILKRERWGVQEIGAVECVLVGMDCVQVHVN